MQRSSIRAEVQRGADPECDRWAYGDFRCTTGGRHQPTADLVYCVYCMYYLWQCVTCMMYLSINDGLVRVKVWFYLLKTPGYGG